MTELIFENEVERKIREGEVSLEEVLKMNDEDLLRLYHYHNDTYFHAQ